MPGIDNIFVSSAPQSKPVDNAYDISQNIAANDAINQYRTAQTAGAMNDLQQKQRSMQLSMLNGVLAEQDPDKQRDIINKIVPIANKLNPSYQIDPNIDVPTIRALIQSQVPASDLPTYQMNQAKANFYNRLAGSGQQQQAPQQTDSNGQQPAQPNAAVQPPAQGAQPAAQPSNGGMTAGSILQDPNTAAALSIFDPAGATALTGVQKLQYESPQGKAATAKAEAEAKNAVDAAKGVTGIDSRIQNAINILDDQIDLAPKTASGHIGEANVGLDRELANIGIKRSLPANQTKFEQNNANLFTQELPAIISGMPGSRLDIPLVNAIKQASQINEYGTPQEKIAAAQNLKGLLQKYQQNTHNNAAGLGAGNIPVPAVNDKNAPATAAQQAQAKLNGGKQPVTGTPIINTQAAFDALPSGSVYVEADGKKYRKP